MPCEKDGNGYLKLVFHVNGRFTEKTELHRDLWLKQSTHAEVRQFVYFRWEMTEFIILETYN